MNKLGLLIPVVPEQFRRVGSADGAVAAAHVIGWAELVAAPADPLWVFGMKGRLWRFGLFLVHGSLQIGVARRTSCADLRACDSRRGTCACC